MNDLELALNLQAQYDGKIPAKLLNGVSYSILNIEDGIVDLLFEGSHDIEDAKRDLDAFMGNCPFGRVHWGAWEGLQSVIDAELDNLPSTVKIRCSGHSLGSMRAALAKRELYRRGYTDLEAIGFESPHYGDAQAVAYSGNDNERGYQNYKDLFVNDIFTMIPPHLLLEPYIPWANLKSYYQKPSPDNEYKEFIENIQMHSLSDCCIKYLRTIFPCAQA